MHIDFHRYLQLEYSSVIIMQLAVSFAYLNQKKKDSYIQNSQAWSQMHHRSYALG